MFLCQCALSKRISWFHDYGIFSVNLKFHFPRCNDVKFVRFLPIPKYNLIFLKSKQQCVVRYCIFLILRQIRKYGSFINEGLCDFIIFFRDLLHCFSECDIRDAKKITFGESLSCCRSLSSVKKSKFSKTCSFCEYDVCLFLFWLSLVGVSNYLYLSRNDKKEKTGHISLPKNNSLFFTLKNTHFLNKFQSLASGESIEIEMLR